uniref:Uncharacterized protein n=1 Tax=Arundo donax TaxID=35708 RepID=A0A0A8Z4B9_ARUDO
MAEHIQAHTSPSVYWHSIQ